MKYLHCLLAGPLLFLLCLVSYVPPVFALNIDSLPKELEKIRFQVRWHHQYQFAGYYAAKHKGFFAEAGFDVEIIDGSPERQPVTEVLAGRADFAEGNSEVLISRLRGEPIIALAAIFQQSPSVLLTLADSHINHASQLKGHSVMLAGNDDDADLLAMFSVAGLSKNDINVIPSSYDISDLSNGSVTAFNSYLSNEPYFLALQDIKYNIIKPQDYGIKFYSDILFTTQEQVNKDPKRVERFKQAVLKGWRYAIHNSEEIINIIYTQYNDEKTLNHMRYEALAINALVHSEILPVGHIFEPRIEKMADVFIEQGMVKDKTHLDGFIFVAPQKFSPKLYFGFFVAVIVTLLSLLVAGLFIKMNFKLKLEISRRKDYQEKLQHLADTDGLTQLLNRRAFMRQYQQHEALARRYNQTFCLALFDLDLFKNINDQYGHDAGDRVLLAVAAILKDSIRDSDVCARFGGEEFIWLFPNTSLAQALNCVERVRLAFENEGVTLDNEHVIQFTASFGVIQGDKEELCELLNHVDRALYKAKAAGRNTVHAEVA
ncbi:GGDEF domain-containing protein [Psychrobium sp. 1_MG-2023]|uniref:GGDEF domain-containing protein n=1 Tax=Psychrobium sp. 1_MG-2023 TaxID=3062624 RepID=UPI0026D64194|nr:GGDEF domain-containing protein [Psychrobium sp. 1_MG-2023]MDP2561789.1 diguanylate cyclase [Psychrobium sp. 1_MG-2023]